MKVFVTADLHFGHENILGHQDNREFSDITEMNDHIVREWNGKVSDKDKVYVVGDFSFRMDLDDLAYYMGQLNGEIHLVKGNHDHDFWKAYEILKARRHQEKGTKHPDQIIIHRDRIVDLKHGGYKYVMCHYPMETWDGSARNSSGYKVNGRRTFMLHGHNHGKGTLVKDRIDVGWDSTGNVVTLLDDIPAMIEANNQQLLIDEMAELQQYEELIIGG